MINFILKKFPNLSYTAIIALVNIFWCGLCALFGVFIILSKADFEKTGTGSIFVFSVIFYFALMAIPALIDWGALRVFGLKVERKDFKILNENIKNGRIIPNLSCQDLAEVFKSLIQGPKKAVFASLKYVSAVIFLVVSTEFIVSGRNLNIIPIISGGLISLFLAVSFVAFSTEYAIFPVLKECRAILFKRGIKMEKEDFVLLDTKKKFSVFLLFPIFVVFMILWFFTAFDFYILLVLAIGTLMAFIISQVISFSIYQTFYDIKKFIKRLPGREKVIFSTGSLDADILELSENLNLAAEEVYISKGKLEESNKILEQKVAERTKNLKELAESLEHQVKERTKELNKRLEELEKFRELTIGRELKMVELKKEIEKLKAEKEVKK